MSKEAKKTIFAEKKKRSETCEYLKSKEKLEKEKEVEKAMDEQKIQYQEECEEKEEETVSISKEKEKKEPDVNLNRFIIVHEKKTKKGKEFFKEEIPFLSYDGETNQKEKEEFNGNLLSQSIPSSFDAKQKNVNHLDVSNNNNYYNYYSNYDNDNKNNDNEDNHNIVKYNKDMQNEQSKFLKRRRLTPYVREPPNSSFPFINQLYYNSSFSSFSCFSSSSFCASFFSSSPYFFCSSFFSSSSFVSPSFFFFFCCFHIISLKNNVK